MSIDPSTRRAGARRAACYAAANRWLARYLDNNNALIDLRRDDGERPAIGLAHRLLDEGYVASTRTLVQRQGARGVARLSVGLALIGVGLVGLIADMATLSEHSGATGAWQDQGSGINPVCTAPACQLALLVPISAALFMGILWTALGVAPLREARKEGRRARAVPGGLAFAF